MRVVVAGKEEGVQVMALTITVGSRGAQVERRIYVDMLAQT